MKTFALVISLTALILTNGASATSYVWDYCHEARHAEMYVSTQYPGSLLDLVATGTRVTNFRRILGRISFAVKLEDRAGNSYYVETHHRFGRGHDLCDLHNVEEISRERGERLFSSP